MIMLAAGISPTQRAAWRWAMAAWFALIVLTLAWELVLAPLRPGGSWLALKALPLLLPLPWLLRGSTDALQVALFIAMLYVFEGATRLFEPGPSAWLAALELVLVTGFLAAAIVYLRPLKLAARRRARGGD
jgi:uncharacterized membrane protein